MAQDGAAANGGMGDTIVVATGNAHKVTEIEAILSRALPGTRFVALHELGDFPDPVEDGDSFEANALIKARAAHEQTGLVAIADDSGLVVDALGGEPGIYSARYAGVHGDDAANNAKLLRNMRDVPTAPHRPMVTRMKNVIHTGLITSRFIASSCHSRASTPPIPAM